MKKRMKQQETDFGDYLRIRVSRPLKKRLKDIAAQRPVPAGQRPASVSDVAREYLLKAAEAA